MLGKREGRRRGRQRMRWLDGITDSRDMVNYKPPNVPWAFQSGSVLIVSHDLSIKRLTGYRQF